MILGNFANDGAGTGGLLVTFPQKFFKFDSKQMVVFTMSSR
jgi:hypothetical protein